MDEDGLPIMGAGVDYLSVEAINQRKSINYINSFIVSTAAFMTSFSSKCEIKLTKLSSRLNKIETSLKLIEEKLNSIPELKDLKLDNDQVTQPTTELNLPPPPSPPLSLSLTLQNGQEMTQLLLPNPPPPPAAPIEPPKDIITVSKDPRFVKYFKMLNMGVPATAVKLKMKSEGIDPALLDSPDEPAPNVSLDNQKREGDDDKMMNEN